MKKKAEEKLPRRPHSSMRMLVLFCTVTSLIVIVSLCYRVFIMIEQSKFDGKSGFIVALEQNDKKKAVLYSFDPTEERLNRVFITSKEPIESLSKSLTIPIDGILRRNEVRDTPNYPFQFTSSSIYTEQDAYAVSPYDAFRLWWYARNLSETKKHGEVISLPEHQDEIETKTADFFIDSRLEQDKKTIAIINGTTISGLGGKLEARLTRIGGTVISITTAHDTIPTSKIIYYGDKSYTVERLERVLPFQSEKREGNSLSDILIEIGEDSKRSSLF